MSVMLTITGLATQPSLEEAAGELGVPVSDLDMDFGVILLDSEEGTYVVRSVEKDRDGHPMRNYGQLCLAPIPQMSAEQIRGLREREGVSQTVFSYHLGVTENLFRKWESGEKTPKGSALKLLYLVSKKGLQFIAS